LKTREQSIFPFPSKILVASIVTSRARIKLLSHVLHLHADKDNKVLYVDTDSIFLASKKDLRGKVFGDVSFKNSFCDEAIFVNIRAYSTQTEGKSVTKIAGYRRNLFSFTEMVRKFLISVLF
jgi:DNA polymerase elongation subunit (family B)